MKHSGLHLPKYEAFQKLANAVAAAATIRITISIPSFLQQKLTKTGILSLSFFNRQGHCFLGGLIEETKDRDFFQKRQ